MKHTYYNFSTNYVLLFTFFTGGERSMVYIVFTGITIVYWLLTLLFKGELAAINMAFMTGLVSIVVVAIIAIINSGLFYLFFEGFSVIKDWLTPENRAAQRTNKLIKQDIAFQNFKERIQKNLFKVFLTIGITSIITSILINILYL